MTDTPHPAPDLVQRLRHPLACFHYEDDLRALLTEAADALAWANERYDSVHQYRVRGKNGWTGWIDGSLEAVYGDGAPSINEQARTLYAHPPATEPAPPAGKGDALRGALAQSLDALEDYVNYGYCPVRDRDRAIDKARAALKDTP